MASKAPAAAAGKKVKGETINSKLALVMKSGVKKLANQNLFEMSHLNSPDKFINVTNGASYTTTNKKGVPHKIVGRGPSQSGLDLSHMTLSQYKSLRESGLNRKVLKKDGSMSIASSMSINT